MADDVREGHQQPRPAIVGVVRFRITVRGEQPNGLRDGIDHVELRGYIDGSIDEVTALSRAMEGIGIVVASGADDDYDPFGDWSH